MRKGIAKAVVILLAALATSASGCMPIWEGRALEEELQELRARQVELEAEASAREETFLGTLASAQEDIESLEAVLDEARRFLSENSANLGADVQQNREEMGRVLGELEALEFRFRRFQENFEYFREDVDLRFAEEFPADPDELLAMAQELEDQGDFRRARRAYERFLSRHGDHPRKNTARLKLGEILFAEEQWVNAIGEFQQLLQRGSGSTDSQQARASLRIGESMRAMGQCEDAMIFFETVFEDHPRSDDVSEARRQFGELESGQCP